MNKFYNLFISSDWGGNTSSARKKRNILLPQLNARLMIVILIAMLPSYTKADLDLNDGQGFLEVEPAIVNAESDVVI